MSNKPRDESPTAAFEADEWMRLLPRQEQNLEQQQEGDLFGIVLVANWPPNDSITQPYTQFLPKVKTYFDAEDYKLKGPHNTPAVYLYPPHTLHITIATFTTFNAPEPNDRDEYAQACKTITEKAFARPDWPNRPFSIVIDRVHIGCKAGVLLWENTDGVVGIMRTIVQEEYDTFYKGNPAALNHRDHLIIPGIIHKSFLRFGRSPQTNRVDVKKRFEEDANDIKDCFGKIEVNSVRLAVERIPYMHIPYDERHVLTSFEVSAEVNE
jgi:hypothetical protein